MKEGFALGGIMRRGIQGIFVGMNDSATMKGSIISPALPESPPLDAMNSIC